MTRSWPSEALGSLVDQARGISYGIVQPGEHDPQGVPIVRAGDIRDSRINTSAPLRVSSNIEAAYSRTRLRGGELVMSIVGSVGQAAIVPQQLAGWNTARAVAVIPVREEIGAYWVKLALRTQAVQERINSRLNTTVQATLNLRDISALPIPLPAIEVRQAIASVLGALDDKIELNRRMNETLEALARTIFKDWFVDFGPTRAKMEGRAPYFAPDIWSLFPNHLDDDGRPEGWRIEELGNVTSELRRGISPAYTDGGGVRVLNQKCIRNRQIDLAPSRRHDPSRRAIDGRLLVAGDILVNSTGVGTLGRVGQIWEVEEPSIVDSHVTVVRADAGSVALSYLGLNLTGRETEIEALGEGSTGQTELARSRLAQLPVLVPSDPVQELFEDAVHPLLDRMASNTRESRTLATTRDLLLPKLMSGEVRMKDAEKIVGEAT